MDRYTFDDLYVRRLKEHDPAIEAHFDKYFRDLLSAKLYGRLSAQNVEDAVQDVLLRVLARLDALREACKLGAFVMGVCNKVLLERYSNKESRTEPLGPKHEEVRDTSDVEAELIKKETAACVRRVLSDMGETRDAYILREIFIEEVDRDEVCRRFNVDAEYLRVLLHRAKEKFRAAYRRRNKRNFFEMFDALWPLLL
jgi:RNA polymerase sigma-70 factor (ECF subfamily)